MVKAFYEKIHRIKGEINTNHSLVGHTFINRGGTGHKECVFYGGEKNICPKDFVLTVVGGNRAEIILFFI